ncbi:unnamed protein product [Chrysoparadoxa australica]
MSTGDSRDIKAQVEGLTGLVTNGKARFEVELEFVQCLASPEYLHYLAQQRYLDDPAFLAFLRYLRYWKRPEYAKHLTYPHCLYLLEALCESEQFRSQLLFPHFRDFIHQQQFNHWRHFRTDPLADAKLIAEEQAKKAEEGELPDANVPTAAQVK